VTLYRGVYPVIFAVTGSDHSTENLYRALFTRLLELQLVKKRDLVILTKGELSGVQAAPTPCRSSRSRWTEPARMRTLKYIGRRRCRAPARGTHPWHWAVACLAPAAGGCEQ